MIPHMSGPTDNIYRFIALFGLAPLISSIIALVYTHDTYFVVDIMVFKKLEY
jgi:hypothetical protein